MEKISNCDFEYKSSTLFKHKNFEKSNYLIKKCKIKSICPKGFGYRLRTYNKQVRVLSNVIFKKLICEINKHKKFKIFVFLKKDTNSIQIILNF